MLDLYWLDGFPGGRDDASVAVAPLKVKVLELKTTVGLANKAG